MNVVRLGPGKYLFGSRNIICKIVNGKLLVRVGGGFMSADEFIEQYGKIEMLKAMNAAGKDTTEARKSLANAGGVQARKSGSKPRGSTKATGEGYDMGAMKEMM